MHLRFDLRVLTAAAVSCLAGAALFLWFPYTLGHSFHWKSVLAEAWWMWTGNPDWQHGMLVPVLVAFLVYRRRHRLAELPMAGSWGGLAVLGGAALLYFLGYLTDIQYAGDFALNLFLAGLILWFLGPAWLKALAFPCAFLLFMWPMPFFDNVIAFPLRMGMARGAHLVLSVIGVGNDRVGTAIVSSPDFLTGRAQGSLFAIDVADPCSGLHSLFALLMVSALYGYLTLDKTWRKWALFLAAVPLAMIGNVSRIVLLTLATLAFGSDFAIGPEEHPTWFHMLAGYMVFGVALGGMVLIGRLLQSPPRRFRPAPREEGSAREARHEPAPVPAQDPDRRKRRRSDSY